MWSNTQVTFIDDPSTYSFLSTVLKYTFVPYFSGLLKTNKEKKERKKRNSAITYPMDCVVKQHIRIYTGYTGVYTSRSIVGSVLVSRKLKAALKQ